MLKNIAIGLLAGAFLLQAGEEVPKQAGVAFRFDDNKPPKQWKENVFLLYIKEAWSS